MLDAKREKKREYVHSRPLIKINSRNQHCCPTTGPDPVSSYLMLQGSCSLTFSSHAPRRLPSFSRFLRRHPFIGFVVAPYIMYTA